MRIAVVVREVIAGGLGLRWLELAWLVQVGIQYCVDEEEHVDDDGKSEYFVSIELAEKLSKCFQFVHC